jgi:hypothetical protein
MRGTNRKVTYRFAGDLPCVGEERATAAGVSLRGGRNALGGLGEPSSSSRESRLLSMLSIVPVMNPALPQKHW